MSSRRANSLLGLSSRQMGKRLTKWEQAKFLLSSTAPALVQPEEADDLIDYVEDESELLGEATVDRMDTNEKIIRFVDMAGGILRLMTCAPNADVEESATITTTNKCLRTVALDAKFYLCDNDLEDNLTGAQLEQKVNRMAADTIASEVDFLGLMANADASYSNAAMVQNAVLHYGEGWYRQLQFGHLMDANSIDAGDRTLTFNKLNCLGKAIPPKHRKNLAAHRIYMASDMWWDYAALHQARATTLGDSAHLGPLEARHLTTPVRPLALLPTDIQTCGCGSLPSATGTFMFMLEPRNLVAGIQRDVTFERIRKGERHLTWFVYTIRIDFLVLNEDATSMVDCMTLEPCGDDACLPTSLSSRCNQCLDIGTAGAPPGWHAQAA